MPNVHALNILVHVRAGAVAVRGGRLRRLSGGLFVAAGTLVIRGAVIGIMFSRNP